MSVITMDCNYHPIS